MSTRLVLTAVVASCLSFTAARAETIMFHTDMTAAKEVPPKQSDGKGTVSAQLDTSTHMLSYTVDYSGLTGPATAGHFHGPAAAGSNAGVVVPFSGVATSPIKGTATLTEAQQADLMAGKWYANIHTAKNPGGEIRGQMERAQ